MDLDKEASSKSKIRNHPQGSGIPTANANADETHLFALTVGGLPLSAM